MSNAGAELLTADQIQRIAEAGRRARQADTWAPEVGRRRQVSQAFVERIRQSGLMEGEDLTVEALADVVRHQLQIQNLNPVVLPQLLGSHGYYRHFKDFEGTPEELAELLARKYPRRQVPIHPGADLTRLSGQLRTLFAEPGPEWPAALEGLLGQPGIGQGFATGALILWRPERYGLVNGGAQGPFENGVLQLSDAQRDRLLQVAGALPGAAGLRREAQRILGWEVLLQEVRKAAGLDDFLEVDWLLWTLRTGEPSASVDRPAAGVREASPRYEGARLEPEEVDALVRRQAPEDLEVRRKSEAAARQLIADNLGQLTETQLRRLLELINTAWSSRGGAVNGRFGLAFMGRWATAIVTEVEAANRWIRRLWEAPADQVGEVLDAFWSARELRGAGMGFPTAILYLRDPTRWAVSLTPLRQGLARVVGRHPPRGRTAAAYLAFNREAQALRESLGLPAEALDFLLSLAAKEGESTTEPVEPPESPGAGFPGFSNDTFEFLRGLADNNRDEWFKANRKTYRQAVFQPLKALVAEVGQRFIASVEPPLEHTPKAPHTLAAIRKNLWGKKADDAYWPFLWAAFHRRDTPRITDFQLYVMIHGDFVSYGISFSSAGPEDLERFVGRLQSSPELAERCFRQATASEGTWWPSDFDPTPLPVDSVSGLRAALVERKGQLLFARRRPASDPLLRDPAFAQELEDTFRALMPLFLLAVAEQAPAAAAYLEAGEGDETEAVDDPDDEAASLDRFVDETFLTPEFVEEMEALLRDKPQLIFSGPPGTGKTFVAERLARYLAGSAERVRLVQFHASYAYEDFIEGLRPVLVDGAVRYEVKAGIFRSLCEQARRSKKPHVLVIDEINRGNLARIFGELLYALERRGAEVQLPYSQKALVVPPNLYVIGTMNTADHSIALVDFALRRRFHFVSFDPDYGVLERWLLRHRPHLRGVRGLLESLNGELQAHGLDPNLLVGHSHFMRPGLTEGLLEQIWNRTILPTLEEVFYGQPERVQQFTYEAFATALAVDEDLPAAVDEDER